MGLGEHEIGRYHRQAFGSNSLRNFGGDTMIRVAIGTHSEKARGVHQHAAPIEHPLLARVEVRLRKVLMLVGRHVGRSIQA